MAKLEEITELLTNELEEFKKGITHLEKLSKDLKNSEVAFDLSDIKRQLCQLKTNQDDHFHSHDSELRNLSSDLAKAKLTPKWLLALFCIASILTVLALGYFGYHFIQLEDSKAETFENGKEQVILDLKGYFDEHPEVYKGFQAWSKEQERVPNQK
ncbi:DUF6730 family protein [Pricia sp.]|uniref:DUF6730 family protein n=1 Tax=Pricia sp. TaxID=2268138 RepID=UPI003593EADB